MVAIDGGRWEIYVGGAAGAHVRKGDLLATVDVPDEVITLTGRFLQYYRENANWLERTYAFVPRIGIEKIRAIVVDDSEGIAADLDAAMGRRSPPTRTPGRSATDPATPGQFRTAAAADVLPQVPVRWRASSARQIVLGPRRPDPGRGGPHLRRRRRRWSPSSGCATAGVRAVSARSARTTAARSPTARSTTRSWSARCTSTPSTWRPAVPPTGQADLASWAVDRRRRRSHW